MDSFGFAGNEHCVERCGNYAIVINGNKWFNRPQFLEASISLVLILKVV
jgi:hypothetical protein